MKFYLDSPTLITCSPGPAYFGVSNLKHHNINQLSDSERAVGQHLELVKTIEHTGTKVINLKEMPGHPNSVFTKDTACCLPQGYVRLRMGLPSRNGEEQWMADTLESFGKPMLFSIEPPGMVEGGDVILAEKVAFIGHSSRTNRAGTEQLGTFLKKFGYAVRNVQVPAPFLHLGGTMTLVAPDTILCVGRLFPDPLLKGFHVIEVPNTGFISGNVIPLPDRQIIADQANTSAVNTLADNGFELFSLDLSEFVKGTGGPSCLILNVT
ncbi:dimethylarginine dimethylaminohydrolase family protein [Bacteroidota bacterium]